MKFRNPGSKEDASVCSTGIAIVTIFPPTEEPWLRFVLGVPLTVKYQDKYMLAIMERKLHV